MYPVELFSNSRDRLGESPRWHPIHNMLYWVDIDRGLIHHQAPGDKQPVTINVGLKLGCLAFSRSGDLILATEKGFQRWDETLNVLTAIDDPESGKQGARFNDGLVDAGGRFWAGTMTETDATSNLYRLDPDISMHKMEGGITISNGIGWNKEATRMYFTDTMKHTVWLYDFNAQTGVISNRRVFLEVDGPGLPDGLTVDMDGNVWCVICGAGRIQVHDPDGHQIDELLFPTRCITACTFGGTDLSDLFVTSSIRLLEPSEQPEDKLAGNTFVVATHTHGQPDHLFG
jgi:sugar lactone lactonase YvrE